MKEADQTKLQKKNIAKLVLRGAGWLFAVKEFNPKNWLKAGYTRGAVFKTALSNAKTLIPANRQYRKETFQQACKRLKLTEADLQLRYRESVLSSRSCYIFAMIFIALSFYCALDANVTSCIGAISLTMVALTYAMKASFLAWRITVRRLAHPREFIRTPEAWIV
ncbi:MAG: hypothetical protein K2P92_05320 [Bdellovibrionaceae bacterium]|nr:hypothetical protein [Pseudobdellovibrionaceae bacterium]